MGSSDFPLLLHSRLGTNTIAGWRRTCKEPVSVHGLRRSINHRPIIQAVIAVSATSTTISMRLISFRQFQVTSV